MKIKVVMLIFLSNLLKTFLIRVQNNRNILKLRKVRKVILILRKLSLVMLRWLRSKVVVRVVAIMGNKIMKLLLMMDLMKGKAMIVVLRIIVKMIRLEDSKNFLAGITF